MAHKPEPGAHGLHQLVAPSTTVLSSASYSYFLRIEVRAPGKDEDSDLRLHAKPSLVARYNSFAQEVQFGSDFWFSTLPGRLIDKEHGDRGQRIDEHHDGSKVS